MKLIFPNLIEAIGTIFAINRVIRGKLKFNDPVAEIAITEVFGITALTDKMENGPVLAEFIDGIDEANLHPRYIRSNIIPELLVKYDYDFVYHIFDAWSYDKEIGEKMESIIGIVYNTHEIMAKSIAYIDECIHFYQKNADREFPQWELPNAINAMWRLVSHDALVFSSGDQDDFEAQLMKQLETIDWN